MTLDQCGSQLGSILPPRDTGQRLETFLEARTEMKMGGVLLVPSGQWSGMLPNIL